MGLVIAFGILFVVVLFSVIISLREKHKNQGFIITSAVLMIADVLCILMITCDTMRLIYYPVQSKTDKLEYTYIPTWRIELRRNDYYLIATMFLNAIDGSLIEIQYPETE